MCLFSVSLWICCWVVGILRFCLLAMCLFGFCLVVLFLVVCVDWVLLCGFVVYLVCVNWLE